MKDTDNNAKGRKPGRRIPRHYAKWAAVAALLVAGLALNFMAEGCHERRTRHGEAVQEKRGMARQRLEDSLDEALRRRKDSLEAHPITPGQRRRMDETLRRQLAGQPDPEELMERYNRGEELTQEEKDFLYDYYRDEYYEDPDDEGDYPSEIFDEPEDYDEEHVRDNPGVAGDD